MLENPAVTIQEAIAKHRQSLIAKLRQLMQLEVWQRTTLLLCLIPNNIKALPIHNPIK
jgi:hypothetical protein